MRIQEQALLFGVPLASANSTREKELLIFQIISDGKEGSYKSRTVEYNS